MNYKALHKQIDYDGSQLRSHFVFESCGILGDGAVAFIGACDVNPKHMVDVVDKKDGCKIYSEEMLHFIVERFGGDLDHMILHQRIFVSLLADALRSYKPDLIIKRNGNDLFDGSAKLNISIATASPVSCLMHIGININSENTPVKTKGLADYKINPKTFAEKVLKRYKKEVGSIAIARSKAKPVT